jgi:hypothetical protein
MFHVAFKKVLLGADVFGLLADQGVLGASKGALVAVLQDGGYLVMGSLKISSIC